MRVTPAETRGKEVCPTLGQTQVEVTSRHRIVETSIDKSLTGFDHFCIDNWYAPDEESRDAIEKLAREGYTVNPIPAYDINGDLLVPRHYTRLSGALVHVKFQITHQYLRSKKTDNFYGEIQGIWVLRDAPKASTSPSKRRLLQDMKLANKRKRGY